ncbi:MAG TPA: tetratricopeptide repeat protein [Candidatus Binatia bacterium]|nr:tetratricopeptide repeat protein [Candidatus Binatia bacterium]
MKLPEGIPAANKDEEAKLLARLEEPCADGDLADRIHQLAVFYIKHGRNDLAIAVIELAMNYCDDPEKQAFFYMNLGQISEHDRQFQNAIRYYARGLELKPNEKSVAYLLHNNLGYCLNTEKRYKEAEEFCRAAILIDSTRANAFKNLGTSLRGQGDIVGAAWVYAEANRVDPSDPRAITLLDQLIAEHPKALFDFVYAFLTNPSEIT